MKYTTHCVAEIGPKSKLPIQDVKHCRPTAFQKLHEHHFDLQETPSVSQLTVRKKSFFFFLDNTDTPAIC